MYEQKYLVLLNNNKPGVWCSEQDTSCATFNRLKPKLCLSVLTCSDSPCCCHISPTNNLYLLNRCLEKLIMSAFGISRAIYHQSFVCLLNSIVIECFYFSRWLLSLLDLLTDFKANIMLNGFFQLITKNKTEHTNLWAVLSIKSLKENKLRWYFRKWHFKSQNTFTIKTSKYDFT